MNSLMVTRESSGDIYSSGMLQLYVNFSNLAETEHGAVKETECAETTTQPFFAFSDTDHGDDGYCHQRIPGLLDSELEVAACTCH